MQLKYKILIGTIKQLTFLHTQLFPCFSLSEQHLSRGIRAWPAQKAASSCCGVSQRPEEPSSGIPAAVQTRVRRNPGVLPWSPRAAHPTKHNPLPSTASHFQRKHCFSICFLAHGGPKLHFTQSSRTLKIVAKFGIFWFLVMVAN